MVKKTTTTKPSERSGLAFAMAFFFLCGFSSVLNVVLIPYLQSVFKMQYAPAALIQVSFYTAYFIFSPLTGFLFNKRPCLEGIRSGLLAGFFGCLTIYMASVASSYPLIVLGIFILGAGIAMIQVTGNPYVMMIGAKEAAASRLTLAQAFTSMGTVVAPYLGSLFLLSSLNGDGDSLRIADSLLHLLYLALAGIWMGLLLFTFLFALPKDSGTPQLKEQTVINPIHPFQESFVLMGWLAIALSTGIEISISTYLIKFLSSYEIAGVSMSLAGKLMMLFWMGFLIGRLAGSRWLKRSTPEKILRFHAIGGIVFCALTVITPGVIAAIAVISLGFFISILFPVIFSLVLAGCRSEKSSTAGFLCMANIGGALLPLLQGILADQVGLSLSFLLPLMGFSYILYYSRYLATREVLA